jgi:hypothetical protein
MQCLASGYVYRYKDVFNQIGSLPHYISFGCYITSIVSGIIIGTTVDDGKLIGLAVALFIFLTGIIVGVWFAKTPTINPYKLMNRLYFVTMYQINTLGKDLNVHVSVDGQYEIPFAWGFIMTYHQVVLQNINILSEFYR